MQFTIAAATLLAAVSAQTFVPCTPNTDYCGYELLGGQHNYPEVVIDQALVDAGLPISPTNFDKLEYNSLYFCNSTGGINYLEYCGVGACNPPSGQLQASCRNGPQPIPARKRWEA